MDSGKSIHKRNSGNEEKKGMYFEERSTKLRRLKKDTMKLDEKKQEEAENEDVEKARVKD